MITIIGAEKAYQTKSIRTLALNNISLAVTPGEFVAIMGPSGSGKSTLLNVIGLFERLDKGQLILAGENVEGLRQGKRIDLRRRWLSYIFQSFNLISHMTVFDNVALPLKYRGVATALRRERVNQQLKNLGLEQRSHHYPAQLSGGQQQRVAIARAMISNPALLLADEPTGNLDSTTSREVLEQLTDIHQGGTTVVMVTHAPEAAAYASRVLQMKDGRTYRL